MRQRTSSYPSLGKVRDPKKPHMLSDVAYSQGPVEVHNLDSRNPLVAKNYDGYRIVFSTQFGEGRFTMYTSRGGHSVLPTPEKLNAFRQDVEAAAKTDPAVETFLKKYPFPN